MSLQSRISGTFQKATDSLTVRDYRLFYTGQFMSFTGTWMRRTALGWLVFEITGSYALLGMVFTLMTLPLLFCSPFAGSLADKYSKRNLIILTQTIAGLLSVILAVFSIFQWIDATYVLLFALLSGTAFSFEVPARQSFIKALVGKEKLQNAIALNSALINLTRILGPAVGGFIMSMYDSVFTGAAVVFLIDAFSYLLVIVMLFAVKNLGNPSATDEERRASRVFDGLRVVKRNPLVYKAIVLLFTMGVFGWSFQTLLPGIVNEQLGLDERYFGILMSVFGLGASVAALLVAINSREINPMRSMQLGMVTMGVSLTLLSLYSNFYWMAIFMIPTGFGAVTFLSTANSLVQSNVEDSVRGKVMGVWALSFGGSLPIGSFFAGLIAAKIGPLTTILLGNLTLLTLLTIINMAFASQADKQAASA